MIPSQTYYNELVNPMTYPEFKSLTEELIVQGKTTGDEQTEQKISFTKLNQQRMKRVEKQFVMQPELSELLAQKNLNWNWLILVEAWCGDGAQILPAIAAIAEQTPGIILTVLLRDENPELMNTCLTNGSKAIPKLICEDAETGERLFTWGARPTAIQQQVVQLKAENPAIAHEELVQQVQLWYAKDRSQALQQDLINLVREVLEVPSTIAEV
ncbi:thioredoxin family protein [Pontibacter sp. BT310]|uniref:Thioredoxin family protein n=1 Tax=Pontibacter populi TaxID=890055 RepID=A0ABS6XAY1_9BACT|nr:MULTISPECIES: thioredoxin family protein [Pontibacter]MBJ6118314.1 thioredoxin family protein [Pontibacter sp. BT310]MBR0570741.1 thioredoxin family protein [Microvirga sp. STS03]MBW3365167.1 thioredoxin family protein [Pontibacter populi]